MTEQSGTRETYYAPWEKTFGRILTPFEEFVGRETAGGLILVVCTVIALVVANSPLSDAYASFLHTHIAFSVGVFRVDHTLHHWINDGLMAFFFFVVGLEIKREVVTGDLSGVRAAALPVIAAIGGMTVPALIYFAFNSGTDAVDGWAIPMATDIAFALGVLALLGQRVPASLFTFLVALAIVDDLGAVGVIAIFYTEQIAMGPLAVAGSLLGLMIVLNLAGVRNPIPYFLVAMPLWLAMLESGIHATVAGVLGAMTIPIRPKYEPQTFSRYLRRLMDKFDELDGGEKTLLKSERQRGIVQAVETAIHRVESPLQRLEHAFHAPVAFLIVPVFALANAGIPLDFGRIGAVMSQPVSLGVALGLMAGKIVGAGGFSLLAVRLGFAQLPDGCRPVHIIGASLVAGIGFTMSIFIAELAFRDGVAAYLLQAKTGILFASLTAGVAGYLLLRQAAKYAEAPG